MYRTSIFNQIITLNNSLQILKQKAIQKHRINKHFFQKIKFNYKQLKFNLENM